MKPMKLTLVAAVLLTVAYSAPHTAAAEEQPVTTPPTASTAAAFSQSQIDAYAKSAIVVNAIMSEMLPKIEAAASSDEKQSLTSAMQALLIEAVNNNDAITIAEYNAISTQVRQDEALAGKIIDAMKAEKGIR